MNLKQRLSRGVDYLCMDGVVRYGDHVGVAKWSKCLYSHDLLIFSYT